MQERGESQYDDVVEESVDNSNENIDVEDVTPAITPNPRPTYSKHPSKRRYPIAEETYRVMKKLGEKVNTKDEFSIFKEHITCQLRKCTDLHDLAIAKRRINDVLFDLEMATHSNQCSQNDFTGF